LGDLKKKKIRFIGNPSERIHEDPLRILRAIRFKVDLKFQLEMETKKALQKNFARLYEVSDNKLKQEMGKIKNISAQKKISKIIFSKKSLDKSFY
jgi:tRNA nucleotidyltransferase/poly(A) polymerase